MKQEKFVLLLKSCRMRVQCHPSLYTHLCENGEVVASVVLVTGQSDAPPGSIPFSQDASQ